MLVVIRPARAALGSGDGQHGSQLVAQPGFVVLRRLTPVGQSKPESRLRMAREILRLLPCSPAMGLHFDLDPGRESEHLPDSHHAAVRPRDQYRPDDMTADHRRRRTPFRQLTSTAVVRDPTHPRSVYLPYGPQLLPSGYRTCEALSAHAPAALPEARGRITPDGSINLIGFGIRRIVKECNVCLHGRGRLQRQVVFRKAAQDGLAPDNNYIGITGDR